MGGPMPPPMGIDLSQQPQAVRAPGMPNMPNLPPGTDPSAVEAARSAGVIA
jgi:hypothetical protein